MAITKYLIWVAAGEPVHSDGESVAPVWPHPRLEWSVRRF
jgi:hypothetical protein